MVEQKKIYVGSLSIPEGATGVIIGLNLTDEGKKLLLEVPYLPPGHVAWDSRNDQFIDQYMGQDDNDIIRRQQEVNLLSLLKDKGDKIERKMVKRPQHYNSVEDRVVLFQSGARGEIVIDDEKRVYLYYYPAE